MKNADKLLIAQLREEIEQYKAQEQFLLLRLKKAEETRRG